MEGVDPADNNTAVVACNLQALLSEEWLMRTIGHRLFLALRAVLEVSATVSRSAPHDRLRILTLQMNKRRQ